MKKSVIVILMMVFFFQISGADGRSKLTVELRNLKVEGTVYITLYNNENGYPMDSNKAFAKNMKKVTANTEKIVFIDVPYGTYAVSVWHDQNDNQKMEKNLIGIPKEGLGVSNDAKGKMGPPKFADAKFEIKQEKTDIFITVKY